ncbi:Fc receptor-like B isoform X2 [Lithobates pipiens]
MSVFLAIVILSLNVGKSGGAIKPVVTFTPNWGNILEGDSVALTCDVPSTVPEEPRTYHWYRDKRPIPGDKQRLHIIGSSVGRDSGDYQCQTIGGDISDPVFLNVTLSYVLLQRPPSVIYEGDPLTLRCHHIKGFIAINTKFYKDDQEIKPSESDSTFHIPNITRSQSGRYRCTKQIYGSDSSNVRGHSDESFISVKELFSPPEIKVTPSRVIEGDEMTVRCDTRRDPLRGGTELHFAFYRDGWTVRGYDVSDTYRVPSSQLEDSGKYTCEVRKRSSSVSTMSDELYIQIHDNELPGAVIAAAVIGSLVVIVVSALLIWKRKKRKRFSHQDPHQAIPTAENNTDPDLQDVCYTYLDISQLSRGKRIQHEDPTVTYATVNNTNI